MHTRHRHALALAIAAAALFGCSKPDPLFCDQDTPCTDPELSFCDLEGEFPASEGIKRTCIPEPDFAFAIADDDAQVRIDGQLALDVTVERIDGFPSDILVEAVGLPAGASAEPITIPGDATTGTLTILGGDADPGALADVTVTATAGPFERSADLHLLVLGPAGTLDPTFGSNGLVGEPVESNMDDAIALMQLDDGSIIVGGPTTSPSDEAVLVRYSADGDLDASFGAGGSTQISFDDAGIPVNATIKFAQQSDGKLIIANGSTSGDIALARLTTDGQLDSSFAGGGVVAVGIAGGLTIWVESIGIGRDDEIVVAMAVDDSRQQLSVVRFDRNGEKDLAFAGGRFDLDRGTNHTASAIRVFADGSVLLRGTAFETDPPAIPFVVRLTATGVLDSSFGEGGELTLPSGFGVIAVEDSGAMLLIDVVDTNAVFRRLTAAGDADSTFGDDGELMVSVPAGWSGGTFLPGPAGLLAAGRPDITLTRFDLEAGALDSTFGEGGIATVAIENIAAKRVLRQPDGRILVLADEDSLPFVLARFFE